MSSRRLRPTTAFSTAVLLSLATVAMAQNSSCISLAGSTQCPAFNTASVSTGDSLTGLFPFLAYVSDTDSFDQYLAAYVQSSFVQQRYVQLLGCSNIDLDNTTNVYARYTTSVLCNAIVQNSIDDCSLSDDESRPLCADTCAEYAISEQEIAAAPALCGTTSDNVNTQIRADFTNCALPANSLTGTCISGVQNEPNNCGYLDNLQGLCSFCASSSPNATDSCCNNSNVNERCQNVELPTTTSMPPLFTSSTASPTATSAAGNGSGVRRGLSPGQIAGIVIGAVLGAALLLTFMICACIIFRRRRASQVGSVFNTPSPSRGNTVAPAMSYSNMREQPPIPPTGRVARMNALEETSSSDPYSSPREGHRYGQSDGSGGSPRSAVVAAGRLPKRNGSLSSSSRLNIGDEPRSPEPNSNDEEFSSPEMGSGQSEQLPFFKDYYSQDEIRPGDSVAVLWAYQPRANDEFDLERGEMIKVMGIWDDGWATGMKITQTADDWDADRKMQRDSGMSNGSQRLVETVGEVKAFPLVCVCLPQHWRKTIDGDSSAGDSDRPPTHSP
ncbi:hypothetical protein BFW01_g12182 [Lasiodiplodia theobromae]|uniref:SH3 domain-containing protein n=1 Tax=Lasiodiplodia theobromae TaxID=45133 RepID=A0A5N5DHW9_9PEZI|nr:Sh3 domain protein [Lasiodiplodia theobromae]KAB2577435.1 hypothetical protein DBV05_g3944 [Lasiodiplodia theobromae]KAF4540426.1 Sh3 domain protein [Lasiodiplodia theobromae]KAF9640376.1 hypothetical protein BFW01_g12182 [Lasiodiplodia theobromae]